MTTRKDLTSILLVAFLVLFLVGDLSYAPVRAQRSVAVYDHGFARGVEWTKKGRPIFLNRTSTFTQDDPKIYAFVQAAFYAANFTWEWFTPTGDLYANQSSGQQQCTETPCSLYSGIRLQDSYVATQIGEWRMDLLADGFRLYSDYFSIIPVITEDDYWNFVVTQSAPPRVHVDLVVTIHPSNETWQTYVIDGLTYADNLTAYELPSHLKLDVAINSTNGQVVVNFAGAKQDGYSFVLSFDLKYGLVSLGQWSDGIFALTWREYGRATHFHVTPESFNITLPGGARVIDVNGINMFALNYNMTDQPSPLLSFSMVRQPTEFLGWTLVYRDYAFRDSHPSTPAAKPTAWAGFQSVQIPILPLTLSNLSLWSAVMSVFMLTGSELLSSSHSRTNIVINRRRLRIAALILVLLFLLATAYQILSSNLIAAR